MKESEINRRLQAKEKFLAPLDPLKGDVSLVMAYPNRYWLAMSNLGYQAVYKLFSEHARLSVQRAYLPENEDEVPKTFEKNLPISNADILAISVSFETDYVNVLKLIAASGVNLAERTESSEEFESKHGYHPLIIAGGAALTLNPEPLADFLDVIVLGEAEEVIHEITEVYLSWRDRNETRKELLLELSGIEGVYVPSLVRPHYNQDNTVKKFENIGHKLFPVKRRFVKDISQFPTSTVIQTPETEFKSMYMTETGRGCEVGCRFCVAGYMYRPIRKRDESVLNDAVQVGVENGESVGFVGAAVSSHPAISKLASSVAKKGKRAALSSIMSQRVSSELAGSLSESEYKTVALAPEAGSEELRFRIGKRVLNEQIVSGVETLAAEGIRNFKLYFMIALPGETDEDVEAIVGLVKEVKERLSVSTKGFKVAPKLILSVNPFIPKSWTPFQRHPFTGSKEAKRKLAIIKAGIKRLGNVELKSESPRESWFQTLMSRGDRRVGKILEYLLQEGKDWRWLVKNGSNQIIPEAPAPVFYVERLLAKDELAPWEVSDFGIKRELLDREYQRCFDEDVSSLISRARKKLASEEVGSSSKSKAEVSSAIDEIVERAVPAESKSQLESLAPSVA